MQELIIPARVIFCKTGRAKYISHLDTMRTFTRALRRSGLPLWYTQGYNPHLYLTFPLPLALGVESRCEPLDFRLTQEMDFDAVGSRMAASLPPGFGVESAGAPKMPATAIAWAEYRVEAGYPQEEREAVLFALKALFSKPEMMVMKRSKKGETLMDIRPHATLLESRADGSGVVLSLRLAAGNTLNISPTLVLDALARETRPPDRVRVERTRILDGARQVFA